MDTSRVDMPQVTADFCHLLQKFSVWNTAGSKEGKNWYPEPSLLGKASCWHVKSHLYLACKEEHRPLGQLCFTVQEMWVESSSSSSSLSDFGISISHQVFQWFNEIWSWCIRKLRGWSSVSSNFGKSLKPLTECLESNLDRPGILWHLDFQFLITSNKIFQMLLVWG